MLRNDERRCRFKEKINRCLLLLYEILVSSYQVTHSTMYVKYFHYFQYFSWFHQTRLAGAGILSIRLLFCCQTCERDVLKMNVKLILMPICTSDVWEKDMKRSTLGGQDVKGHMMPKIDVEDR